VHGEELIVSVRLKEMIVGHGKLQTHQESLEPADHEKKQTGQEVENGDAFVIDRGKPREPMVRPHRWV
jgi:hypothetical protein